LSFVFSNHTFISCVDDTFALIQYEQNIYMVNYNVASEELFYQVVLGQFQNMGRLVLSTPLSIKECVLIAVKLEEAKGNLPNDIKSADDIAEVRIKKEV
jgi:DNA mismatch repair protein MLH1